MIRNHTRLGAILSAAMLAGLWVALMATPATAEKPSEKAVAPPHTQLFDSIPTFKPYKVMGANLATPEGNPQLIPGKPVTLLDVQGAGQVVRLHFTVGQSGDPDFYQDFLIRIYFDGEKDPSVMAPLGSFFLDTFCGGQGYKTETLQYTSMFFANWGQHFVCYLPMPYSDGCRITMEKQGKNPDGLVAYDVLYEEWDECPAYMGRFHAAYHRQNPMSPSEPYILLDTKGRGHYIGASMAVQSLGKPSVEFLEGMANIIIDDQPEPMYKVWGSEDYFGGSYYFHRGPYAGDFGGCTMIDTKLGRFNGYRFHIPDAIPFEKSIKVLIKHSAVGSYEGRGDYSSVAYWYQQEPHDTSFYGGYTAEERALTPLTIENSNVIDAMRAELLELKNADPNKELNK